MSPASDSIDRALVARVEQRDADALGELYDRHAARLMGLSLRILGEAAEADEVLQEVFLQVWRSAASFDPSRGTVLAWLLVATRSRSIDRLRALRSSGRLVTSPLAQAAEPIAPEDGEGLVANREWESLCRAAIAELPPEQRLAIELAYFEGLTHQEIADRTATPLGTVKTRVRLGLVKLRDRIRPYWTTGAHGA